MQLDLNQRVLHAIKHHRMFRAGDRVGVAASGGADSVALLRWLEDVREELGVSLAVLHFNHQLRGAQSDADEKFVASLAAARGFEFLAGRGDVATEAREHGWNLEDAARRMRYAFFESAVRVGKVTCVAVAHTADDQAETVLARMIRGTGPAGLAAIYPVKGHVVRPLLEVRRAELREYLEGCGQSWHEDASNLDTTRLRARLRHQLLPVIERDLQPAIVEHLSRMAQMAREDEAFWVSLIAERLRTLVVREGNRLGIRCSDLVAPVSWAGRNSEEAQVAVTKRLVRGMTEALAGGRLQLTARHVEQVLHLASESSSGSRAELPGIVVERSFDWIWFERTAPARAERSGTQVPSSGEGSQRCSQGAETKEFSYHVQVPSAPGETSTVAVPEIGKCFRLKVFDWPVLARETITQGILDRDLLQSPLLLRNWRPGDSYRPLGRRNAHKLKQLFRVGRVGVRDRAGWPVLISAGQLAWSRGFPVAADFAPRNDTRIGVVISEERI